jgi:hypothetical protein
VLNPPGALKIRQPGRKRSPPAPNNGSGTLSAPVKWKRAGESPAPFMFLRRETYLHCMQGSPFTMIGPQTGAGATPFWGELYWRCSASF